MMLCYCFDIDGTLCTTSGLSYEDAEPIEERIKVLNSLYEKGHKIVLFTARGTVTGIDHRALTEAQLKQWGVDYHELYMGKPFYDIFVDDKAFNDKTFFGDNK